jgi:hypothetical protein
MVMPLFLGHSFLLSIPDQSFKLSQTTSKIPLPVVHSLFTCELQNEDLSPFEGKEVKIS